MPYSPKRHLSTEQVVQIVAGYLAGATALELGERFEVNRTTVSKLLKDHGVAMRHQPLDPKGVKEAIRIYKSGLSLAQVGQHAYRDPNSVRLILEETGIPRRNTHGQ